MKIQNDPIRFIAPDYEYNALEEWAEQHKIDYELEDKKRKEALELAIQCVNDGTLTLLDGIDSPLSCKIKEYFQEDVFEMNSNWISSSQHWICPCCGRSKFQIARLGKKKQILAKLVIHHDHIDKALEAAFNRIFIETKTGKETQTGRIFIDRMAPAFSAYAPILICEDCNNADACAKRWLKENDPINVEFQSFSIGQIRYFIESKPHSIHSINHKYLKEIWDTVKPAYMARMKLIYSVATAAVTQDYWYERYPSDFQAITALADNRYTTRQTGFEWLNIYEFEQTMRQANYAHPSDWSRWRTEEKKAGAKPPENYYAILHSNPNHARMWDELEDNWQCPVCNRSKFDLITNENNEVFFRTCRTDKKNRLWGKLPFICIHCHNTLAAIKRELQQEHHLKMERAYDVCSPEQLRSIIIRREHSPHLIDTQKAKKLIELVKLKAKEKSNVNDY